MRMTVKDLRNALIEAADDLKVVFQANEANEENEDPAYNDGEPGYTVSAGYVYGAFARKEEFVIDGAIVEKFD